MWGGGAVSTLMGTPSALEVFKVLGYPPYFPKILACAQLLGIAAILLPVPRMLREWAYAGLAFDVSFGILSLWSVGSAPFQFVFPLIGLGLVLTSYRGWRGRI
jgi:hypothetical protein